MDELPGFRSDPNWLDETIFLVTTHIKESGECGTVEETVRRTLLVSGGRIIRAARDGLAETL